MTCPPSNPATPFLSIIFPVFNEESRLLESFRKIRAALPIIMAAYPGTMEIIFCDDGSIDRTADLLDEFVAANTNSFQSSVIHMPLNIGKGGSIAEGIKQSRGQWVMFTDVDISIPLESVSVLAKGNFSDYDVILGNRAANLAERSVLRLVQGNVFRLLTRLVLPGFRDTQCPFKVFRQGAARDLFTDLQWPRFGFDLEILKKIRIRNYRFTHVDVPFRDVPGSKLNPVKVPLALLWDVLRVPFIR